MKFSLKRGALLLPFFFLCINYLNAADISKYFDVFYMDIEKYDHWLVLDKNDSFKDIFISTYNLPDKTKRKFIHKINMKIIPGYSNNESYGYLYIDVPSRIDTEFLVYGIKEGTLTVNGAKKGNISIKGETGYVLVKGSFEKGIYFISIKIETKMDGVPIKVLSSKNIALSSSKGFTKESSFNIAVTNIDPKEKDTVFSRTYKNFCFPYNEQSAVSKDLFFSISNRLNPSEFSSNALIYYLYSLSGRSSEVKVLKKTGFYESQIKWWQKNFFEKEVCFDESGR